MAQRFKGKHPNKAKGPTALFSDWLAADKRGINEDHLPTCYWERTAPGHRHRALNHPATQWKVAFAYPGGREAVELMDRHRLLALRKNGRVYGARPVVN